MTGPHWCNEKSLQCGGEEELVVLVERKRVYREKVTVIDLEALSTYTPSRIEFILFLKQHKQTIELLNYLIKKVEMYSFINRTHFLTSSSSDNSTGGRWWQHQQQHWWLVSMSSGGNSQRQQLLRQYQAQFLTRFQSGLSSFAAILPDHSVLLLFGNTSATTAAAATTTIAVAVAATAATIAVVALSLLQHDQSVPLLLS